MSLNKIKPLKNIYENGKYLENNGTWHTEDSPLKSQLVINTINRNKIEFLTCADVGCGAGLVIELLAKHYKTKCFSGYESSPDVKFLLNQRERLANLEFYNENFLSQHKKYELITCLDVFEHIEDCYGFLRSLKNKGDKFIFNIPLDMNVMKILSPGIKYAREEVGHLHYFNVYTALAILKDTGYSVKSANICFTFLKTKPRNIRQFAILPFRLLSMVFGKNIAAKLFGGVSLMVYAE